MKLTQLHHGDYAWRIEPKGIGLCLAYHVNAVRYDVLLKCHPLADDGVTVQLDRPYIFPHFETVDLGSLERTMTITDHLESRETKGFFITHGPERGLGVYQPRMSRDRESGFRMFDSRRTYESTFRFFKNTLGGFFDESKWS